MTVTFNGQDKSVAYEPHAAIQALLSHAKQAFDVQSNHLLSLFSEAGVELNDNSSAHTFMYQAIDAAADSITFAISGALEIKLTWLAFNSFVFAFMRFAMNRSKSGLMALS